MPYFYWNDINTFDFEKLDSQKTIAILTTGSIEQHGPHLPVGVDTMIITKILEGVLENTPDDFTVIALPIMPIGKACEHLNFDGTLSLSTKTIIGLWTDIGESIFRTKINKLLMLNGHGGQTTVSQIVARDLRVKFDKLVVPINWWTFRTPDIYTEEEYVHGLHGGAEETSLMKYLYPNSVNNEKSENFIPSSLKDSKKYPMLYGTGVKHAWKAEDLHPKGATGDASIATAEDGKKIYDETVTSIVKLLHEMASLK